MKKNWWISGEWNAICDVCGFKFKASQLRQRWDGLRVCSEDWETRHSQELIRPMRDQAKLPWTRPETDNEVDPVCTITGIQGIAGLGIAGCALLGFNLGGVPVNV